MIPHIPIRNMYMSDECTDAPMYTLSMPEEDIKIRLDDRSERAVPLSLTARVLILKALQPQ